MCITGVADRVSEGARDACTRVPANEARGYLALIWLGYGHETLNHSTDEHATDSAPTSSTENQWDLSRRGYASRHPWAGHNGFRRLLGGFAGHVR